MYQYNEAKIGPYLAVNPSSKCLNDVMVSDRVLSDILRGLLYGELNAHDRQICAVNGINSYKYDGLVNTVESGTLESEYTNLPFAFTRELHDEVMSDSLLASFANSTTTSIDEADIAVSETGLQWYLGLSTATQRAIAILLREKLSLDIATLKIYKVRRSSLNDLKISCNISIDNSDVFFSHFKCHSSFMDGYVSNAGTAPMPKGAYYKALVGDEQGGKDIGGMNRESKKLLFPLFSKMVVEFGTDNRIFVYVSNQNLNLASPANVKYSIGNVEEAFNHALGIPNAMSWDFEKDSLQLSAADNAIAEDPGSPSEPSPDVPSTNDNTSSTSGPPSSGEEDSQGDTSQSTKTTVPQGGAEAQENGCVLSCKDMLSAYEIVEYHSRLREMETELKQMRVERRYRNLFLSAALVAWLWR